MWFSLIAVLQYKLCHLVTVLRATQDQLGLYGAFEITTITSTEINVVDCQWCQCHHLESSSSSGTSNISQRNALIPASLKVDKNSVYYSASVNKILHSNSCDCRPRSHWKLKQRPPYGPRLHIGWSMEGRMEGWIWPVVVRLLPWNIQHQLYHSLNTFVSHNMQQDSQQAVIESVCLAFHVSRFQL